MVSATCALVRQLNLPLSHNKCAKCEARNYSENRAGKPKHENYTTKSHNKIPQRVEKPRQNGIIFYFTL